MKNFKFQISNFKFLFLFLLLTAYPSLLTVNAQIAVRGEQVWTMTANEPIRDGMVLINNGKIERVGAANSIQIPANYRVITAKVVTPGLIDARTVVGIAGYLAQPHDQMQVETSAPMQPELRAIDSYNTEEKLIEWLRSFGVTTIHTGHGTGVAVSGQTMVAKTIGKTADEAAIVPTAMIAATLGDSSLFSGGRAPGTRAKQIAMLRAELLRAQDYNRRVDDAKGDATKMPTRDLRQEMFGRVLRREIPILITVHRHQDIVTAIRLGKEFNLRLVLDGVSEAQRVLPEIKASGYPVIVHPTMYRAAGETEKLSMETASKLKQAGIPFALQSGFEAYVPKTRVVLLEAGMAAANGLSQRDALAAITIDAAQLLGIQARVGSLAAGKDADLALFDGDPFEFTTHCVGTIINGNVVSEVVR
ncbi:MAG: amidohydrolase family protein [Acidobacteriota bacterium]|nr:amidohydrolase family protein [Acidobacteriota bacterium]